MSLTDLSLLEVSLFVAALLLAWANGANDTYKGVATLVGSRTLSHRSALAWATITTLLGSLTAVFLAGRLLAAFSGRGVVPAALVGQPELLLSVGLGAAAVVLLATWRGLPISTTHALVGGLAGAGLAAAGPGAIGWRNLAVGFAAPLLASPLLAAALVAVACAWARRRAARASATSLTPDRNLVPRSQAGAALAPPRQISQRMLDAGHMFSAGAVGFARGLNDTPKIAALLMTTGGAATLSSTSATVAVGAGMTCGAWLGSRRVGHTLSWEISAMQSGPGFVANVVTALLVTVASRFGLPVSTTHVSVGALFGLGLGSGGLVRSTTKRILLAWLVTLPAAALCAAVAMALLG